MSADQGMPQVANPATVQASLEVQALSFCGCSLSEYPPASHMQIYAKQVDDLCLMLAECSCARLMAIS